MNIKISVAMTCFNCRPYLVDAFYSVASQTYKNFELIFVDDVSADGSFETARKIKKSLPEIADKIKIYRRKENGGYGPCLRDAFDYSTGDLIAIVDADDAIAPDALEIMVKAHRKYPQASVVYSRSYWCDSLLNPCKMGPSSKIPNGKTLLDCLDGGPKEGRVSHLKVIKKSHYDKLKYKAGYLMDGTPLRKRVDKDLALKCEEVGELVFIPDILYLYRDRQGNLTNEYHRMTKEEKEKILKVSRQSIEDAYIRRGIHK